MISGRRPWLTTWGEVIRSVTELDPDDMICFAGGPHSPDDLCLLVDAVELEEDEDVPPEAAEQGWTTTLIEEELDGVLGNLKQQVANPSLDLMIRATAHYVRNDAYIELPEPPKINN